MNHQNLRIALCLAGAATGLQLACSSSSQNVDSNGAGGAVSSAGSGSTPISSNGGAGASGGALASGGSGNVSGTSAGGGTPSAGAGGSPAGGNAGTSSGGSVGAGGGGAAGGGPSASGVAFGASRVVVTGVRGTAAPVASSLINLHNGGTAAVQITSLALSGPDMALFRVATPSAFPAAIAPGADLAVTIAMTTTGATLPAPLGEDAGSVVLTASLTAVSSLGAAAASVYGVVLEKSIWEPTLGEILTTLGYKLNVGKAQTSFNPNTSMDATKLPGVEAGTDEVPASHFVKAGAGNVGMVLVARFSPIGALPYGWYKTTSGCPTGCTTVGTMAQVTDAQTSDKARMVYPPLTAGSMTEFDPGTGQFGLWVNSDQFSQVFKEGGTKTNGDYDYSQDMLNVPANANVHRFKSYPLKDAAGAAIANSYLVAVEEASNGDYQDYVFVLSNVTAVP